MSTSLLHHLESGGKLFITLAGAMSTAGIGKLLAPLIHRGSIAGISCTGANLEEDVFRMMAFPHYETIENWRLLSVSDEEEPFQEVEPRTRCLPIRSQPEEHLLNAGAHPL